LNRKRSSARLVDLESLDAEPGAIDGEAEASHRASVATLLNLVRKLKPIDQQIILLYLEGETASSIADVTGLSPGNVATKIHRIKRVLRTQFESEENNG